MRRTGHKHRKVCHIGRLKITKPALKPVIRKQWIPASPILNLDQMTFHHDTLMLNQLNAHRFYANLFLTIFLLNFLLQKSAAATPLSLFYTDFPPFTFRNEMGEPSGVLIDYFTYMMHISDVNYVSKYIPPKRFVKILEQGEPMIVTGLPYLIDKELYYVSDDPVLTMHFRFYWLEGTKPIENISEFRNTRLAAILGYTYGRILTTLDERQNVEVRYIPGSASSLDLLKAG